ncbi:hypothetical protein QAD02_018590 [Eretmocerus hayati]|uniref:Uncharacterized protein n=1 Tax=Eretmocerus hayati TaxID=131215 RepID=A0ACC2PID5_9HYME|nr:hypothetical protein QAD02_018590 [Eretmocerus hayati]
MTRSRRNDGNEGAKDHSKRQKTELVARYNIPTSNSFDLLASQNKMDTNGTDERDNTKMATKKIEPPPIVITSIDADHESLVAVIESIITGTVHSTYSKEGTKLLSRQRRGLQENHRHPGSRWESYLLYIHTPSRKT